MILGRLAEAIRRQNWFTVVLEILIVVIGIFIGLQVDDWNQRRIERENDERALALFVDELELMLDEANVDLRISSEFLQALSVGTEIAMGCDATDEERIRLATAIGNTLHWRIPDIRPSGLAEISNSGTLARLGNHELSRTVGDIHQSIQSWADSMQLVAPLYDRAFEMLLPFLEITAPIRLRKLEVGMERQSPSEYLSLVPHETLCGNQQFLMGLSLLTSFYESIVYNFEEWQRALQAAYALAAGELGISRHRS